MPEGVTKEGTSILLEAEKASLPVLSRTVTSAFQDKRNAEMNKSKKRKSQLVSIRVCYYSYG